MCAGGVPAVCAPAPALTEPLSALSLEERGQVLFVRRVLAPDRQGEEARAVVVSRLQRSSAF